MAVYLGEAWRISSAFRDTPTSRRSSKTVATYGPSNQRPDVLGPLGGGDELRLLDAGRDRATGKAPELREHQGAVPHRDI
jgi:hypothetical protein